MTESISKINMSSSLLVIDLIVPLFPFFFNNYIFFYDRHRYHHRLCSRPILPPSHFCGRNIHNFQTAITSTKEPNWQTNPTMLCKKIYFPQQMLSFLPPKRRFIAQTNCVLPTFPIQTLYARKSPSSTRKTS